MASTPTCTFERYVEEGILPPEYAESKDMERMVRPILKPEFVDVLVAGDPGRNQSRAYLCNHIQGAPVSKEVKLPANWKALRKG